jgi:hypothetical protein
LDLILAELAHEAVGHGGRLQLVHGVEEIERAAREQQRLCLAAGDEDRNRIDRLRRGERSPMCGKLSRPCPGCRANGTGVSVLVVHE